MAERRRRASTPPDTRAARDVILDAAESLFAEQGFTGVAISDVCRASGYPVGSIYHHFRNKAGLLNAVLQRGADQFFESLNPIPVPELSPERQLKAYYERAAELAVEHHRILRLQALLEMQGPDDPEVRAILHAMTDLAIRRLTAMIEPFAVHAGVTHPHELAVDLAEFTLAHTAGLIVTTDGREAAMRAGMRRLYRFVVSSVLHPDEHSVTAMASGLAAP